MQLQQRYLQEHGVYAHHTTLLKWVTASAQAPERLDLNDECIHQHACGEYVLERLQGGARPQDVVVEVLERYLVQTTWQRLVQYRRYRENSVGYFSSNQLGQLHWEFLYGFAPALYEQHSLPVDGDRILPRRDSPSKTKAYEDAIAAVRTALATKLEVSESTILQTELLTFYREHIHYAVIPTLYGDARTMKEVLPEEAITMYRQTFAGEALMDSPSYLFQSKEYRHCWRAQRVAQEGGIVLMPKQCSDAALVAAYAMEK